MENQIFQIVRRIEEKLDRIGEKFAELEGRLMVVESHNGDALDEIKEEAHQADKRLAILERNFSGWRYVLDWIGKVAVGVAVAWIAYKLGVPTLP